MKQASIKEIKASIAKAKKEGINSLEFKKLRSNQIYSLIINNPKYYLSLAPYINKTLSHIIMTDVNKACVYQKDSWLNYILQRYILHNDLEKRLIDVYEIGSKEKETIFFSVNAFNQDFLYIGELGEKIQRKKLLGFTSVSFLLKPQELTKVLIKNPNCSFMLLQKINTYYQRAFPDEKKIIAKIRNHRNYSPSKAILELLENN